MSLKTYSSREIFFQIFSAIIYLNYLTSIQPVPQPLGYPHPNGNK